MTSSVTAVSDDKVWTLDEARILACGLNACLKDKGYAVGLTGGTLFNGRSEKDVDLILYPRGDSHGTYETLCTNLNEYGLTRVRGSKEVRAGWIYNHDSTDDKHVEEWSHGGRRVDLFFLK